MWNPLLELLFLEQANGFVASYLVEIDVANIARVPGDFRRLHRTRPLTLGTLRRAR